MSRTDDLAQAERQIAAKQAEIQTIQKEYVTYHDEVTATIKGILEDAGVYDQIHEMELERMAVQKKAQEKIQAIQQSLAKLNAAKEFLQGLGQDASKTESPEEPITEEVVEVAEEEVVEVAPEPTPEPIPEPVKEAKPVSKPAQAPKKPKPPSF